MVSCCLVLPWVWWNFHGCKTFPWKRQIFELHQDLDEELPTIPWDRLDTDRWGIEAGWQVKNMWHWNRFSYFFNMCFPMGCWCGLEWNRLGRVIRGLRLDCGVRSRTAFVKDYDTPGFSEGHLKCDDLNMFFNINQLWLCTYIRIHI